MISTPLLFIALPLAIAPLAYYLRRWRWAEIGLSLAAAILLALLAAFFPLEVTLGPFTLVSNSFVILGRSFVVEAADRPALSLMFVQAALIFGGASLQATSRYFFVAGFAALGLLAAALLVNPFLYAAIFLEVAAAAAVFMLSDERHTVTRGALRFLTYTTLGVPFILLTGWLLDASAASPDDPRFITQATLAAGVGFVILLGVLPFHSWLAVVAEHAPPLASAFVFAVVQSGIVFLLLKSLNAYDWFGQNALVRSTMALAGLGMVLVGTLFALGQRNLGRSLGYVMMMDVGALLLALSAGTRIGTEAALATLTLRGFALALWSAGLNQLRRAAPDGADDVEALRGLGWRYPLATAATVFGVLALVGFPLTMGFPARLALMRVLAQTNLTAALALWLAMVSAGIVCVRAIAALVTPESPDVVLEFNESRVAMAYYGLGIALVLWLGAFPQWLLPAVAQAAQGFSLGP